MIPYILQRPKIAGLLGLGGLVFTAASIFLTSGPVIPSVLAEACSSQPAIPAGQGYAIKWSVQEWLAYKNIPVGPSHWAVLGRLKDGTGENCFTEDWQLQRVVLQSSRDDERGKYIDRGTASQNDLNFTKPAVQTQKTLSSNNRVFGFISRPTAAPNTFPYDSAYEQTDRDWSPLGLYGMLFTSKDDLQASRGFVPVEWQVTGRF